MLSSIRFAAIAFAAASLPIFGVGAAHAQTTLTPTLADQEGTVLAHATWTAFLQGSTTIGGFPVPSAYAGGSADSNGVTTMTLVPVDRLDGPATWAFTICPNASVLTCSKVNVPVSTTMTSSSLGAALSAGTTATRFYAGSSAFGYSDGEVLAPIGKGSTYFNVVNGTLRQFDGQRWTGSAGSGSGTVTSVAGVAPTNGNVPLTAVNVNAIPADGATKIALAQIPNIPISQVTGAVPFIAGNAQLSGGSLTVAFTTQQMPYGVFNCTVTDQSAGATVWTSAPPYGQSITFNGTNSDNFGYQCTGNTSASPSLTATTTSLASSSITPTQGTNVTFTAIVAPSAATGTVIFKDGSTTLGTGTLSSGTATYSTSSLASGSHSITAAYGGDSTHAPSTSAATTVTVSAPPQGNIAYVKGCSANPCTLSSLPGGSLVMLATINGNNSSAQVADSAGGTMPGEVSGWPKALNGGQYYQHLWAIPNLAGTHTLTISYTSEYYSQTSGSAFSGASTTTPINAISYNPSGYAPQCASVTPSASTDMLFSVVTGISTPFNATNMTNPTDNGAGSEVTGAYTQAGASAFTPAWNLNSSTAGDFGCASVALH